MECISDQGKWVGVKSDWRSRSSQLTRQSVFRSGSSSPEISATKNEKDMPMMIIKRCDLDSLAAMTGNGEMLNVNEKKRIPEEKV
jgi:hypothetical protein